MVLGLPYEPEGVVIDSVRRERQCWAREIKTRQ
jgi:hypothetical protein